jgi:hypothetical protein
LTRPGRRSASAGLAGRWLVVVAAWTAVAAAGRMALGPLPRPDPPSLAAWAATHPPADTALAAAVLVTLAAGLYLVIVTTIGLGAGLIGSAAGLGLAARLTPPSLRALLTLAGTAAITAGVSGVLPGTASAAPGPVMTSAAVPPATTAPPAAHPSASARSSPVAQPTSAPGPAPVLRRTGPPEPGPAPVLWWTGPTTPPSGGAPRATSVVPRPSDPGGARPTTAPRPTASLPSTGSSPSGPSPSPTHPVRPPAATAPGTPQPATPQPATPEPATPITGTAAPHGERAGPPGEQRRRSRPAPIRRRRQAARPSAAGPGRAGEVDTVLHVVAPGESFWSIAADRLESLGLGTDPSQVAPYCRLLVSSNRDRLPVPGDPDLLFPGDVVAVPPPPPTVIGGSPR